ncbi:MAG TPA: FxSxx-COOH system tetratricopeptide repeat protein [Ktedonobacteraceae bacterium]|nr:FxSxx-COOH system tetratricopeptide repeat protein [Ktedonobacteraceae bacterium]
MTQTNIEIGSFGSLLKAFRQRQRLTQQHLAQSLGMNRNAIGRWEQGDFLPASKTIVIELARSLRLNEHETHQLLEASLTALSPYWYVPFPRNPFFTGREEILEALHAQLGSHQVVALTQSYALHGLGGIGKTQIALEYAYQHALDYHAVFWIGAETEEQLISSLLHIAEVLQLPERNNKEQLQVIAAVQHWLSTHSQWLVIFDNVEDLDLVPRFLPAVRSGAILITTRSQTLGTLAQGVDLLPMEQEEGMLFLLRRAKVLAPAATREEVQRLAMQMPAQYAAVAELVNALGGLPLALDQAGAYLEETRCGVPAYLDLFRSRRAALLQQRGEGVRDHPASVSTTFALAIAATTERHRAVGDLLRVCALLQPDAIPEELFRQGAEHLGPELAAVCRDELEWNRLLAVARSYSLLQRQPEERTLSLHRLIQAVLLDTMMEGEQKQWMWKILAALDAVFPEVLADTEYATRKQGERLLSHILACLERIGTTGNSLTVASLALKAAWYLDARGQYAEAELLLLRALHVREQVLGSDHLQVASLLNSLADFLRERGRYEEAEALFQQALCIQEQQLGEAHPHVASSLNNLAILCRERGRYEKAEPLFQRALRIWEQQLGPDHPRVAASLNGLANLFNEQGRYEEAGALYQRALHIREQQLGEAHPHVATSLNGLAVIYYKQGRYEEAEPLFQRALRIWEQQLGEAHPHVAYALTNLADLYCEQGKYEEAELLFRRALLIREQRLGPEHPETAETLHKFAELQARQGNYREALSLSRRALTIREQSLGPEHPDVAISLNGLATLFRDQGKYAEAEALYQRALHIQEQRLEQRHPMTAQTHHNLALLYQQQGNRGEAAPLAQRALSIRSQVLGDAHPHTIMTRALLTRLGQECSDEQAFSLLHNVFSRSRIENDELRPFLDACCELHPHAWCRAADLWGTYERWVRQHQERFPLSRHAFTAQLKAHGCRADRTNRARIWRGIALVNKEP